MFEQELYKQEAVSQQKSQEGELFHNYEIKNWNFSPKLYKILAFSAILNLSALLFVGQTNLLTMRGCDSPFVGRVCQVLDTVYLGAVLFGTEREYVDAAYEKTDLGDAEITYIDVSGETAPLSYPEGYFQIANPVQYAMQQQGSDTMAGFSTAVPGFPSNPTLGNELINTPPIMPQPNPNAIQGEAPKSPFSIGGNNPTISRSRKNRRGGNPIAKNPAIDGDDVGSVNANSNTNTAEKTPEVKPTNPISAVTINREPMRVFGQSVAEKLEKKEVDLSKNFKVSAEATLTEDGKIDTDIDKKTKRPKSRVLTSEGDPEMIKVVTEAIAAIGDSGWLGYLRLEGIENIKFTFSQDDDLLLVNITSEQLTPERARLVSSRLTTAISGAFLSDRMGIMKLGDDEKAMLKAATASTNGKQVLLNFKLPKPAAQEMINRNIERARESATGKKQSGKVIDASPDTRTAKN